MTRIWHILIMTVFLTSTPAGAGENALPFAPGEEIRYDVHWQQYKAGEATVKVLPFTRVNQQEAFHFELKVRTNRFIDKLFKVRDRIEGFTDPAFTGSVGYKYTGTGKEKKQVNVAFFPEQGKVVYANFGKTRDPLEVPDQCYDPVSSYFKMRTLDMDRDQGLSFPVTDGKKAFTQKGKILGRETLHLKSGTWDTRVIAPYATHFSGVFKKSRDPSIRVWISDDDQRIPVRIKIKVVVGSIYFDLKDYRPGEQVAVQEKGGPGNS